MTDTPQVFPFTFAVSPPAWSGQSRDWTDRVRALEGARVDSVIVADHFTEGWNIEAMIALSAAAMSTTLLRLQTGVLGNDYRHPVLTRRTAATLDALSGGRLTLGMGAGRMRSDYDAAGLPFDRPGIRIAAPARPWRSSRRCSDPIPSTSRATTTGSTG